MRLNQFISLFSKYSRRESDRLITQGAVKINHIKATQHTQIPFEILYYFVDSNIYNKNDGKVIESSIKDSKNIIESSKNLHKDSINKDSIKNKKQVPISKAQAIKNFRIFINGVELKYYKEMPFSAIIYHKPKGELVSRKDSKNRRLIFDSLDSKFAHFMPVGRLDYASEGLLILSDSKEVVTKLMQSSLPRTYIVKISGQITQKILNGLENGISVKSAVGGHSRSKITNMEIPKMEYKIIKNGNFSKLKVSLNEGKNREIRRFFAHFNAQVLDLKRVSYGFINLNALPCGKTRYFNKEEYKELKEFLKDK